MGELRKVIGKYKTSLQSTTAAVSSVHLLCLGQEKPRMPVGDHTWDYIFRSQPAIPIRRIKLKWEKPRKQYTTDHTWDQSEKASASQANWKLTPFLFWESEWNWIFQILKGEHGKIWRNQCCLETCVLPEICMYFHRKLLLAYISHLSEYVQTLPLHLHLRDDKFKTDLL